MADLTRYKVRQIQVMCNYVQVIIESICLWLKLVELDRVINVLTHVIYLYYT